MFLGRVVGPGAPAWLDTDRGYALAWKTNQRATCSGCGTRADEWDEDDDAYISDHHTCEGCARLAQEQASNLDKAADGSVLPGQHPHLVPRELYRHRPAPRPITTAAPDPDGD